jgi:hypothetical protein
MNGGESAYMVRSRVDSARGELPNSHELGAIANTA